MTTQQNETIAVWQSESQALTSCDRVFLERIKQRGDVIDFNTLQIACDVRDYILERRDLDAKTIYQEVAVYALRGRRARTVRDWVEAIAGFSDVSLQGWSQAGLTMSHFKAARKLYRDGQVEAPADALDACINHSMESRPLTVEEMETLYDPPKPANEQIAEFLEWLKGVLLRRPPFGWDRKKAERFDKWLKQGKEFLK